MRSSLLDVLFRLAGDAFFLAEAETGRLVDANPRAEELTGYTQAELMEMHQSELHPPENVDFYRSIFEKHARGETTVAASVYIRRKNGSIVPVEIQASSFEHEGRRLVFGIFRDTSEKDLLLRRIEQSERQNRIIAEFAPIGLVVHCDGRLVFANKTALRTIGASSVDEVTGQSILSFVHPDDQQQVRERILQMMADGKDVPPMEERLRRIDGSVFVASVLATAMEWGGRPSIMACFTDITEQVSRRRFDESMLTLLQSAFRAADAQKILSDLTGIYRERLGAAAVLVTMRQEGLIHIAASSGLSPGLHDLIEGSAISEDGSVCARSICSKTSVWVENLRSLSISQPIMDQLDKDLLTSSWSFPIEDQNDDTLGALTAYFTSSRLPDQDERELLQQGSYLAAVFMQRQELLDQNFKLSLVARQTGGGVILTDAMRRVIYANDAFTRITGYTFEEVRGRNLRRILQGPATNQATTQFMQERLAQKRGFDCRIFNYRKNGEGFWNDIRIDPMHDRSGSHIGFIGLQTDVTEEMDRQARLEKALEEAGEASRARAGFLSHVSHEIRTPLNTISGIAHLLQSRNPREDQVEEIQVLRRATDELQALVSDILDFSQIDTGHLHFQNQPFSLKTLVGDLCEAIRPDFQGRPVVFEYSIDPAIPDTLYGDPGRIRQIFVHLLANAQKFTTEGMIDLQVTLLQESPENVQIETILTDTGPGIPPDIAARIFEPFYRGDSSLTRKHSGTGLGLAIAQKILEYYGGQIDVTSFPDQGSTFRFRMRLERAPAQNATGPAISLTALNGNRILIVEDYEANILITRKFLELWRIQVDQAHNGEEALHKIKNGNYDLILMDLHMPVMDGYEATKRIRQFNMQIPIIALTASTQNEVIEKVQASGMNDLIVKPFHPAELNRKLARFLQKR